MLFCIHGFYKDNMQDIRKEFYPAHKAFLDTAAEYGVSITMSGPLVQDDGETPIGSLFVIDAPNRDALEKFHQQDPFYKNAIWEKTTITAFARRR